MPIKISNRTVGYNFSITSFLKRFQEQPQKFFSFLGNSAKGGEIGAFSLKIWRFLAMVEKQKIGYQMKFDFVLRTNELAA